MVGGFFPFSSLQTKYFHLLIRRRIAEGANLDVVPSPFMTVNNGLWKATAFFWPWTISFNLELEWMRSSHLHPLNEEPTNKCQTQLGEKRLASKDRSAKLFVQDLVMSGRQQMECLIVILLRCMSHQILCHIWFASFERSLSLANLYSSCAFALALHDNDPFWCKWVSFSDNGRGASFLSHLSCIKFYTSNGKKTSI